jgi:hypothetical protein
METLLNREAAKTPAVEESRKDLEEVTSYLEWHLQSRAKRVSKTCSCCLENRSFDHVLGFSTISGADAVNCEDRSIDGFHGGSTPETTLAGSCACLNQGF